MDSSEKRRITRVVAIGLSSVFIALTWIGCTSPPKARIPSHAFQGVTRVACIGDSITTGSGLANPAESSYPVVLAGILGPAYEVRNYGVSGATLLRDGDVPYWRTPDCQQAREYLPEVVVILLGTNDSKPHNWRYSAAFERDLYALVRAFETLPSQPTVYVCTPPPVFKTLGGINEQTVGGAIAPRIRRLATIDRLPVVDLHQALEQHPEHFPDGVHPDAVGAASIAASVESALRGR